MIHMIFVYGVKNMLCQPSRKQSVSTVIISPSECSAPGLHSFVKSKPARPHELTKSWNKPYSSHVFVPTTSIYSTIIGAKAKGYTMMPQVEETLTCYLSPGSAS